MSAADLLSRAAARIDRQGWLNPSLGLFGDGRVCAYLALNVEAFAVAFSSVDCLADEREACRLLAEHLDLDTSHGLAQPIVDWNDSNDSPEPVIAAMRAAAAGLSQTPGPGMPPAHLAGAAARSLETNLPGPGSP